MKRISHTILLLLTAAVLLSAFGCKSKKGGSDRAFLPVKWDYIVGLPEGFPRLCEAVTTASDTTNADGTTVSITWNILERSDFDKYLKAIESWANVSFSEVGEKTGESYLLETAVNGKTVKAEAAYKADASGDHIEGSLYDSQARIIITNR